MWIEPWCLPFQKWLFFKRVVVTMSCVTWVWTHNLFLLFSFIWFTSFTLFAPYGCFANVLALSIATTFMTLTLILFQRTWCCCFSHRCHLRNQFLGWKWFKKDITYFHLPKCAQFSTSQQLMKVKVTCFGCFNS